MSAEEDRDPLRRARWVNGVMLVAGLLALGAAALALPEVIDILTEDDAAPAGDQLLLDEIADQFALLSFGCLLVVGLCEVALAGIAHRRLGTAPRRALFISAAAGVVPGATIAFLAATATEPGVIAVAAPVALVLAAAGFHQLWLRSRLP